MCNRKAVKSSAKKGRGASGAGWKGLFGRGSSKKDNQRPESEG